MDVSHKMVQTRWMDQIHQYSGESLSKSFRKAEDQVQQKNAVHQLRGGTSGSSVIGKQVRFETACVNVSDIMLTSW